MAGHLGIVAHNAIVAYHTIVGNMAVSHDKAVVANLGFSAVDGATIDGYKLPDGAIVANFYRGFFALKLQVLRDGSNNSAWKNAAILTNSGTFHNGYIAAYPCAFAYGYMAMYNGKRVHFYVVGQSGIGMYIGQRMNHNMCFFQQYLPEGFYGYW
jgi:hypothetical protein